MSGPYEAVDLANRLVQVQSSGATLGTYSVNALGQRVKKTVGGTDTYFFYDEQGRLSGEYDSLGKLIQETVWLEDLPIATLRPVAGSTSTPVQVDLYYVHADHLGSPRAVTRPGDNAMMWRWDNVDPFGANAADENPTGQGWFSYGLRFPGQYYDAETGTNYNYYRDYDPAVGRYIESDPIGLAGGINTYSYSESSPLINSDQFGLQVVIPPPAPPITTPVPPPGIPGYPGTQPPRMHIPELPRPIALCLTSPILCGAIIANKNACEPGPDCEALYRTDTETCSGITRRRGAIKGQACHASAAERYAACLAGRPIPPLNTWNN